MTASRIEEIVRTVKIGADSIAVVYRITAVAGGPDDADRDNGEVRGTWGWVNAQPVRVVVSTTSSESTRTIAIAE